MGRDYELKRIIISGFTDKLVGSY